VKVARDPAATARFPDLGSGEAATLALAIGNRDKYLIIMDDPVGRARAKSLNLPVTGVAGVLLAAKNAGLIEVVRPYLDRLAAEGFRLSSELAHSVLEEAGEG
jgi:predicted nucleic acid-binding protein